MRVIRKADAGYTYVDVTKPYNTLTKYESWKMEISVGGMMKSPKSVECCLICSSILSRRSHPDPTICEGYLTGVRKHAVMTKPFERHG